LAGQGTIGLEILEDLPDVDYIIVPIGGGGLVAGISVAAKQLKPSVKIIVRNLFTPHILFILELLGSLLFLLFSHVIAYYYINRKTSLLSYILTNDTRDTL